MIPDLLPHSNKTEFIKVDDLDSDAYWKALDDKFSEHTGFGEHFDFEESEKKNDLEKSND